MIAQNIHLDTPVRLVSADIIERLQPQLQTQLQRRNIYRSALEAIIGLRNRLVLASLHIKFPRVDLGERSYPVQTCRCGEAQRGSCEYMVETPHVVVLS